MIGLLLREALDILRVRLTRILLYTRNYWIKRNDRRLWRTGRSRVYSRVGCPWWSMTGRVTVDRRSTADIVHAMTGPSHVTESDPRSVSDSRSTLPSSALPSSRSRRSNCSSRSSICRYTAGDRLLLPFNTNATCRSMIVTCSVWELPGSWRVRPLIDVFNPLVGLIYLIILRGPIS